MGSFQKKSGHRLSRIRNEKYQFDLAVSHQWYIVKVILEEH